MTTTDIVRNRWVPVSLIAVAALVAALLVSTAATGPSAATSATAHDGTHADKATTTSARHASPGHAVPRRAFTAHQAAFHDQMRKLWEDHVTWTRLAIVTFADESAGFDATAGRLLKNQKDIGNAIKPFYGKAAGNELTGLLTEHITIAVEILQAAKAGDTAKTNEAVDRWYVNSDEIADFLASANPRYWRQAAMRRAMRGHLDQTLAEAQHELTGDYAASVADYEVIHAHMLGMADVLSNGIMRAFPHRFR